MGFPSTDCCGVCTNKHIEREALNNIQVNNNNRRRRRRQDLSSSWVTPQACHVAHTHTHTSYYPISRVTGNELFSYLFASFPTLFRIAQEHRVARLLSSFLGFLFFSETCTFASSKKKNDIHKRTRIFWCYGSSHRFLFILPCVGFPFSLIELTPFRLRTPPKTLSGHTHFFKIQMQ